jgi:IS1 family transposase
MNRLSIEEQVRVVASLVEGNSLRSTVRMTGIHRTTIQKLLVDLGKACHEYQRKTLVNLTCQRIQCDEIWSFCYCKQKNLPESFQGSFGFGDVWTWAAIDADSKLVLSWLVGQRTIEYACQFMADVRSRLANRVQLTTDGLRSYLQATELAFDWQVDYAMLEKKYGMDSDTKRAEARYSPAKLRKINTIRICGNADPKHISTSYIERQNLTMRMGMRRFTRLTNAFSKKVENHEAAIALHYMWYNFGRTHMTLKTTPAMKAGVADHVWTIEEIVKLLPS